MTKNHNRKINRKRFLFSITPLIILLIAIIGINFLPMTEPVPQTPDPTGTAVSAHPTTAATTPTRPPILQATILPSPTPTSTPRPTISSEAMITLLGPPNESSLPLNGRIAFYWHYSEPLLAGQELVLTLRQNDIVIATSTLNQPNIGAGYQIVIEMADVAEAETADWQVHLQWADDKTPLLTSENRFIRLLSE